MQIKTNKMRSINYVAIATLCLLTFNVFVLGQTTDQTRTKSVCPSHSNFGEKVSYYATREKILPASDVLKFEGGHNDNISVKGSNRSDILIRACVRTWDVSSESARAVAQNIKIETDSVIRSENANADSDDWDVTYEIFVPNMTNLELQAHNGDIKIDSVNGILNFSTRSGDVILSNLSGEVKGETRYGEVFVRLSGNTWIGERFDIETYKGNVSLALPENYSANMEVGTVNGNFMSEVNSLSLINRKEAIGKRFKTAINGGGAFIRVVTTNGNIKIIS